MRDTAATHTTNHHTSMKQHKNTLVFLYLCWRLSSDSVFHVEGLSYQLHVKWMFSRGEFYADWLPQLYTFARSQCLIHFDCALFPNPVGPVNHEAFPLVALLVLQSSNAVVFQLHTPMQHVACATSGFSHGFFTTFRLVTRSRSPSGRRGHCVTEPMQHTVNTHSQPIPQT